MPKISKNYRNCYSMYRVTLFTSHLSFWVTLPVLLSCTSNQGQSVAGSSDIYFTGQEDTRHHMIDHEGFPRSNKHGYDSFDFDVLREKNVKKNVGSYQSFRNDRCKKHHCREKLRRGDVGSLREQPLFHRTMEVSRGIADTT